MRMNEKKKTFVALGLSVVLMISTFLTGCGNNAATNDTANDTTNETSTVATENQNEEAAEPQSEEPSDNKLLVAIQSSDLVTDYDENYLTNYLEEKLGMEIEFYLLPPGTDELRTKVSLMATSGEDLPDVLLVSNALSPEMILQYGSSGVFLNLNEYLADASITPNYNAIPEQDKKIMELAQTMADGNMYSLSSFQPEMWNFTPNRTFINKAWLDKLGLEVPKTTEELKEVLIAFRDKDPNGNGLKDEIGVYGYQGGWYGENVLATLMNSFVFWNRGGQNGGLSLAEDGSTVIAPFVTEGWKKGLLYMNDLYNEGLLAPAVFTDDGTQFKATLNEENNVVGFVSMGSTGNYPDAATNSNFLEMEMIAPVAGPDGVCYVPYTQYTPDQNLFIFSSTQNVELAIRFADEFYNSDTSLIVRYGEEGVDWTRDPEVLSNMTNAYIEEGLYSTLTLASISNMWSENSSQTWHNCNPRYASAETSNTIANGTVEYDKNNPTQLHGKNYVYYADKHPDKLLPLLHYSEEDAAIIQDALTNIPEYANQAMAEFITGARDIESDWNAYLNELNSMGLEQWLSIAQKTYDQSLGN